jgi:hypothetical protein
MVNKTFRVVFTIDVEAYEPVDAANQVNDMLKSDKYLWQYYVQERGKTVIWNIDFEDNPVLIEKLKDKPFIID